MILDKKILVVEDNEINREMLAAILSPHYVVLKSENGVQALSVLEKYGEGISLILLDIMMPVMDGYTFLKHLKADSHLDSIPVIVTTSHDSESDEVAALAHGATDFISKPYRSQVILHRVASIIHLRETSALINQIQYDRITGVYSKDFFCQQIREVLNRNPDIKYDILCSDIEDFKLINDSFGVATGDKILRQVAKLYTQKLGKHGFCGRLSADQFACILEHRDDYADEMFTDSDTCINSGFDNQNVVMKYGIYTVEDRNVSVEQMCDRALLAAHSIKGQYGKHFAIYDDKLRSTLLRRQAITDSMESALHTGQFEVYLQPKYQIWSGKLIGAEALVRWNHPEWGLQSPAEFIPIFEQNGFITKLDQYVWECTCKMMHKWDQKGYPMINVSVNVSRMDIHNSNLVDFLTSLIKQYQLEPSRLHIEITESAYTDTSRQLIETLRELRNLGFIIEMDDFGSGYSSLNMLTEMPIDVLKLDMKFIQTEMMKPSGQGILRFIVSLARWMKLSVVAEGVETKEQLERLQTDGCDYAQGYYFYKPMPVKMFESLLTTESIAYQKNEKSYKISNKRILLVVDEDAGYRAQVRETFADKFEVHEAICCEDVLDVLRSPHYETLMIILSMTLSEEDGVHILDLIQKERGAREVQCIGTGPLDIQLECYAMEQGASDYAVKPHSQNALRRRVLRAISIYSLQRYVPVLQDEACTDSMTGLLNRRGLERVAETLRQENSNAVFMFDLDNLKKYNDKYGHIEGDHLIVHFASLLRSYTHQDDILVRLGGDEFLVVMRNIYSIDDAKNKGTTICKAFYNSHYSDFNTTACSAGVALWSAKEPLYEMIKRADRAMYAAKFANKGECYEWKQTDEYI